METRTETELASEQETDEPKTETTIGQCLEKSKIKFLNGVEESVWVSFVCAIIQKPDGLEYVESVCEAADALLEAYRNRLENGKPNIK